MSAGAADGNVDVVALAEERRRLESWIRSLERERPATPPHIYDRVHSDYVARLERVNAALSQHEGALREEAVNLTSRLALLDGELQLRMDRRAELGLRASVGEIAPEERDAALAGLDQEIAQVSAERDALRHRADRIRALATPGASQRPTIITPPPPPVERGAAATPDPEFAAPPVRPSRSVHPPIHTPPRPSVPVRPPAAPASPPPAAATGPRASTAAPAKTLRCAECAAMNYPTEWYCERCGAELSAL